MPKVNLDELWHDLSKESKSKDLGLQELQKGIVFIPSLVAFNIILWSWIHEQLPETVKLKRKKKKNQQQQQQH